jgi:uncharacterized protein (DUF433 family)
MNVKWRAGVAKEYVEKRDGVYRISGTRVSLDSVVYAFLRGASPESIAQSFPALNLEEVYGAIAFYLAHQAEVDAYLEEGEREFKTLREQSRQSNPLLYRKLQEARQNQAATQK